MPLYDFSCRACGRRFEERVAPDGHVACPACGSADCQRLLSRFAGPFTIGLRGAAARRSNAARRAREELRRERRAQREAERGG
jgi:putative FmdB family regulatory protein